MPRHNKGRGGRPFRPPDSSTWELKMRRGKSHMIPPNLTGKEIGLYFANRKKERNLFNQGKKEMNITFGIPESVENRMRVNLQGISNLAKDLNIRIVSMPNPFLVKTEKSNTDSINSKNTGTFSNQAASKIPSSGVDQFNISWELNVKNEPVDDENLFKKPMQPSTSSASADYIPLKTKTVPVTPDFIAIKSEDPDHYQTSEMVMTLKGGGDYKYGYEDIITGTFEEKLDECLSKGVSVATMSSDIQTLNRDFYLEYENMLNKRGYQKMLNFRQTLPTYKKADVLLDMIENNQVVVISGETGCGKSTQVPQLLLDNALSQKRGANIKIIVTQPRRIAASSLAQRVAQERAEKLGQSVGYAVRLEKVDARTRGSIMFVTTGILLADLEINQGLTEYSHVILDEVHERDCQVDLSLCMLKKVLKKRKDLKLILMSATLDAEQLSEYYDNCPMLHIEGLAYPVQDIYLEDIILMTGYELPPDPENEVRGRAPKWMKHTRRFKDKVSDRMAKQIKHNQEIGPWVDHLIRNKPQYRQIQHTLMDHRIEMINIELMIELLDMISSGPPGAILVFLPGIGDITKLIKAMDFSRRFPSNYFDIYPLHSKLPSLDQHKIFEKPVGMKRKIIIATNIAETSITIDDIVYVIDSAKIKLSGLNVEENISTLRTEFVSQANLRQRRGRAGRCQPGICYHLITSRRAHLLDERLLPEIQRSDLLEPVLTIKRLRLGMAVPAMEVMPAPPAVSTVEWAVNHLQQLGALNEGEMLTPLGWHLARLPVHPSAGKLVLLGALFGCLDRAASVAAVWGFKDPFQLVIGKEREVDATKRSFALGEPSDHVAISEAIIQTERVPPGQQRHQFCYRNFLSHNTIDLLSDMKSQLGNSLKQMGFLPSGNVKATWENRNAMNLSLFKAIVAAALYPKVATVSWKFLNSKRNKRPRIKVHLPGNKKAVNVHPSSIMTVQNKPETQHLDLCDNPGANWLVYWLLQKSSELFLIDVTLVYTLPLLFFGELTVKEIPVASEENDADMCQMSVSKVNVRCKKSTAACLFELRGLLDQVLAAKVMGSGNSQFQELVLNAVVELITAEDERTEYISDDQSESDMSERE